MALPAVTQQPIIHVDATPDEAYPIRILRAYRSNCDVRWKFTPPSELCDILNANCELRAEILDRAIALLKAAWDKHPQKFYDQKCLARVASPEVRQAGEAEVAGDASAAEEA